MLLQFSILLICMTLLNGCTSHHSYSIQPQADNPVRTQKPYTVNGKKYEPLSNANGFVQDGYASSYGHDFHGRKTSSGEIFNMNSMTAAHKTLPFGVYVQVEHKRTGKSVIVRVNDRGPFVQNRIIDLSEAAADKLGILKEGVAPVTLSALGYKSGNTTNDYRQPVSYDHGHFTIQVGAFTVKENALRYRDQLKKKYGAADVQESLVKNSIYYRVRLGNYSSLKQAEASREHYQQNGFPSCFVVAQ